MRTYRLCFAISLFVGVSVHLGATVISGDSVKIMSGTSTMIDVHGICKTISYSGTGAVFVPTKTSEEFNGFLNALPDGVSETDC